MPQRPGMQLLPLRLWAANRGWLLPVEPAVRLAPAVAVQVRPEADGASALQLQEGGGLIASACIGLALSLQTTAGMLTSLAAGLASAQHLHWQCRAGETLIMHVPYENA